MDLAGWDERYRAERDSEVGRVAQPSAVLTAAAAAMPPGRALDLACGTGRHALWLAERGWKVTAVDGSAAAIEAVVAAAAQSGLSISAHVVDLEKDRFDIEPAGWDLIASCYYLQRDLLEAIREGIAPGGIAIVIALLAKSRFRAKPGELRSEFAGWEILHDREGIDHSGTEVAEIVARRPGG
jgi:tellurite methyltransferase